MNPDRHANRQYAIGVARAFAGALLFCLPILMTMETWVLGATMDRYRLVTLLILMLPVLIGLSYYSGFEETTHLQDAVIDAFVAIAVASVVAVIFLVVFGALDTGMNANDWIGQIALQSIPGSIGALLAQSQFGRRQEETKKRRESGDAGEYFFMGAGAIFVAANIAPTEEIILIAARMTPWHALALLTLSVVLMHAFVYSVEFKGQHDRPRGITSFSAFVRFTVVGYCVALLISSCALWSFGRFDGMAIQEGIKALIVLGLPAAVGAAAARLVL